MTSVSVFIAPGERTGRMRLSMPSDVLTQWHRLTSMHPTWQAVTAPGPMCDPPIRWSLNESAVSLWLVRVSTRPRG